MDGQEGEQLSRGPDDPLDEDDIFSDGESLDMDLDDQEEISHQGRLTDESQEDQGIPEHFHGSDDSLPAAPVWIEIDLDWDDSDVGDHEDDFENADIRADQDFQLPERDILDPARLFEKEAHFHKLRAHQPHYNQRTQGICGNQDPADVDMNQLAREFAPKDVYIDWDELNGDFQDSVLDDEEEL